MNKELQDSLRSMENLIGIQRNCINDENGNDMPYMVGILNGLICAHSCIGGDTPQYVSPRNTKRRNQRMKIRHKKRKNEKF